MQILDKNFTTSSRPDDDHQEQWNKWDSSVGHSKPKSKYFNPPKTLPNPKSPRAKKRKVEQGKDEKDAHVNVVLSMRP